MAQQIDDEGLAQIVSDPFIRKQVACIKEVSRMLTIERRDEFAGIEVGITASIDSKHW